MKLIRAVLIVLVLGFTLACTGCSGPNHDDDSSVRADLMLTIPAVSSARVAVKQAIRDLPGVRGVTSIYNEPGQVLDLWVHYEMVPDRWPFVEKIQLTVDSTIRDHTAARSTTVRVWIVDFEDPGRAEGS